jgi:hypothetical protein
VLFLNDPRTAAIPDVHGHAKGEHRPFAEERPIAYSARMLFLWFFHACRRGMPRFLMAADHVNYLTFEDPGAVNTVRRALKLAEAGDLHGAAEAAGVDPGHASVVSEALRRGMRFSLGAEVDNDPRARPDAQNIIDAMRPDGIIRCVSFLTIEHPEKGSDFSWSFDDEEFASLHESFGTERLWEQYVAKLLDDLEKLPSHVAGNFYMPARLGGWPAPERLEEYEDRLLAVCHARKLAVEINTRFLYRETSDEHKKAFLDANARLARKAQALGVGIAIGSDAHSPKDQGNHFDIVLRMLDDAEINELVFPVGGRLARVALRATQEHLEAHDRSREKNVPGSSISGFSRAELGLPEHIETPKGRGAKKRAGGPARPTKRAAASGKSSSKSTSKRSADSSESSTQAKAALTELEADATAQAPTTAKPVKPASKNKAAAKTSEAKAPAVKTAPPAKAAAVKAAPVRKAAEKAKAPEKIKAVEKPKAAEKKPVAKAKPEKSKPVKAAAAKTAPAKQPATAKAPARKTAPAPAKKAAKTPARATAVKKAAPKKPAAKPAARVPARPAKTAAKAAKKTTAKKPSKSAAAPSAKKRPAPKRR